MRPVAAGGLAVLGAAPAAAAPSIGEVGINPPEDLMREHGVLNRVLLIYKEASRRIEAGEPPPAQVVDEAAWVVRRFVEDYHEALEERYVFPTLSDAGRLTSITPELCLQHWRGRVLTDRIHDLANQPDVGGDGPRRALVDAMAAFHGGPNLADLDDTGTVVRVGEALRRSAQIGPYFAMTVIDDRVVRDRAADSATPLAQLYREGTTLVTAIDDMVARLGGGERRVAASTFFLGHAARIWSVALGCWATSGIVPELDPATVWLVSAPGAPVELAVADPTGVRVPIDDEQRAVAAIWQAVVEGHLRSFVGAVHAASRTAPDLLWGNAASALVGAVRVLGSQPALELVPASAAAGARRVAARLLGSAPLAGTTQHDLDADGQLLPNSVVRRSCCLFYRVPGGGTCGDCPLT